MNTRFKSSSSFNSDVNNMGANYLRFRLDNDTGRYIETDTETKRDYVIFKLFSATGVLLDSCEFNVNTGVRIVDSNLDLPNNRIVITNSDGEIISCDITTLINIIDGKVTQVSGKGLSTNDFNDDYKDKLINIEDNANNYMLPDDVPHDANYVHTDNNYTSEEKQKLENLENYDDGDLQQAIITLDETKLDGIKVNEQSIQDADIKTDQESIVFENNKLKLPNEWINYLKEQTFQQPSIDTFILCDINNNALPATYEAGASVKVEKIKHREINIQNISENSLMINGQILPLSDDIAVFDINDVDVTSTTTFTIIGSYIRPSGNSINISKSATITFNRYVYSNVIDSDIIPTTGIKQATINVFATNGADFSYNVGDYIYLFTTSAGKTVQTNVLGQWIDVDAENLGEVAFTQDNDVTYNYYAYRIGPFIASGTAKYRV